MLAGGLQMPMPFELDRTAKRAAGGRASFAESQLNIVVVLTFVQKQQILVLNQ